MNTYYLNDKEFQRKDLYKDFLTENSSTGMLKIRAYAASEAIPVEGIKVEISTIFNNNRIIVYEGITDESGTIEKILLPAPELNSDNLESPPKTAYQILAIYEKYNMEKTYMIVIFEGVCVIQNINVKPSMNMDMGY